jgi:DNA-binding Lrp family transcriptional regulator
MMIDEVDHKLIHILEKDASLNSQKLAKMLNVSSATVRRRLARLIKEKVVHFVALVDTEKVGFPITVGIQMKVVSECIDAAAVKLAEHPRVKSVGFTTGDNNLTALTIFSAMSEFSEFMQNYVSAIDGIQSVTTQIFIKTWKGHFIHEG